VKDGFAISGSRTLDHFYFFIFASSLAQERYYLILRCTNPSK